MRKRKPLCCSVCAHFKLVCIRLRGYGGVGVFSWTVAMITRGHRCSRLTLTCRLRVLHSPPLLHLEKKKKVNSPPPSRCLCWGNKSRWLLGAADLSAKVYSFNRNRNDGPFVDRTSLKTANINYIF